MAAEWTEEDTKEMHMQNSMAALTERVDNLRREFNAHDRKDDENLRRVFDKLDSIQRLIYIAFGGVMVIGSILALIGGNILKLLH